MGQNKKLEHRVEAKYVNDFCFHLRFSDGSEGEVYLGQEMEGEIFALLKDISYFKNFTFNLELHTVVWPNGADFAPEFLFEKLQVLA